MSDNRDAADELRELLAALREDTIDDAQAERLTELLRNDREARRTYIRYMAIAAYLHGSRSDAFDSLAQQAGAIDERQTFADDLPAAACPTVVIEHPAGLPAVFAPLGGFAFSYAAAVVIVGVGLLVGWACQVSGPRPDRHEVVKHGPPPKAASVQPEPAKVVVGVITGMIECLWADPHEAPIGFDRVALGRKFDLKSGLVEISYDSGAKVILQGPCVYEVDSKTGGLLTLGRMTARVEKKADGGRRKANEGKTPDGTIRESRVADPPSPFPLPPSALFTVRTPTAVVTDLGTEFGVEVDRTGASRAHVFLGKVSMRAIGGRAASDKPVVLEVNQSARVDDGEGRIVEATRETSRRDDFVHRMPRRGRIALFNTGVNLKAGEPDPHWQAVARSDKPDFRPRAAIVTGVSNWMWLANQADRSQWISFVGGDSTLSGGPVYTFRTTFELTDVRPATAILHGRFAVDNHVRAIRLNGRKIAVPTHGHEEFGFFHSFSIDRGFVEGVNVLEIEVENRLPGESSSFSPSPMGLLVELDGSVLAAWPDRPMSEIEPKTKE